MTEKRYSHDAIVIVDHLKKDLIYIDGKDDLLELAEYVDRLQEENWQLKQQSDNKQKHIVTLENKIGRMREAIHKLEWLSTHRNADLQRENRQLKKENNALIKLINDLGNEEMDR